MVEREAAHLVRNNGVFPSGNRLFLQSAMAMYCVGEAKVKYDWSGKK